MDFYKFALKIFRPIVTKRRPAFLTAIDFDLKRARINVAPEKYWAAMLLVLVLAFVLTFVISFTISIIFWGLKAFFLLVAFLLAGLVTLIAVIFTYFYPSLIAGERKKRLENALAFSTIYLTTIADSGLPPQHMFRLLAGFKEYGEVSAEAEKIANDVEAMGLDLPTALTRAIARSPSADWTELLAGLRTSISVGGDLRAYLNEKAKGFIQEYHRRLDAFNSLLTILVQMYITIVGVGAVFFIIVSSLIGTIGGISPLMIKAMQYLVIFLGLPIITFAFIFIIKGVSPLEA